VNNIIINIQLAELNKFKSMLRPCVLNQNHGGAAYAMDTSPFPPFVLHYCRVQTLACSVLQ